jgi:hypothetical protein
MLHKVLIVNDALLAVTAFCSEIINCFKVQKNKSEKAPGGIRQLGFFFFKIPSTRGR